MRNRFYAAVAGALVALVTLAGCTTAPEEDKIEWTDEQIAEFEEMFTFKVSTFECETEALGLINTRIYAAPAYGPSSDASPKRVYSDSVSLPLTSDKNDLDALQKESEQFRCHDPFLGLAQGYALGNQIVPGTNTRVFDLEGNDALRLADVEIEEINNLALSYVYQEGDNRDEFIVNNEAYKLYAETLTSILHQLDRRGVLSLLSEKNWHLESPSAGIGNLLLNPKQEDLPSLVFAATLKGQCKPALAFGINLGDQRPEIFNPADLNVCEEEPPPAGVPPAGVTDSTPTPTPECVDCKGPGPENGWTPQEVEGAPAPPAPAPSAPLDPKEQPGSDTGTSVPVVNSTPNPPPAGPPAVEVPQAPEPEDPGTSIGGPPAD